MRVSGRRNRSIARLRRVGSASRRRNRSIARFWSSRLWQVGRSRQAFRKPPSLPSTRWFRTVASAPERGYRPFRAPRSGRCCLGKDHVMPHRLLAALVLSVALVLSGCSDDPEPKVAPKPSAAALSSSPSTSDAAPEPTIPLGATENTAKGAETFVRYWIDLVNYAQETGDVAALERATDERCTACRGVIKAISEPYDGGGRIDGGQWSAGKLRSLPPDYASDWGGYARAESVEQTVTYGDGRSKTYPAGDFDLYAYTAWTRDGWRLRWLRTPY